MWGARGGIEGNPYASKVTTGLTGEKWTCVGGSRGRELKKKIYPYVSKSSNSTSSEKGMSVGGGCYPI